MNEEETRAEYINPKLGDVDNFPTPKELWNRVNSDYNEWKEKFDSILPVSLGAIFLNMLSGNRRMLLLVGSRFRKR